MTTPGQRRPDKKKLKALFEANAEVDWTGASCADDAVRHLFFGPLQQYEHPVARHRREAAAKEICADCPLLESCRAYGLEQREKYGIWGGLTERDRQRIWREQRVTRKGKAS